MRKWTKTAGLLFWAVAAVYSDQATFAKTGSAVNPATPASNVKLLDEAPAAPATDPFATSQPAVEATDNTPGKSVTASEVTVDDTGTVEIHVNDASLVEVLRMLSMQSQRNIIASKDVNGKVTANLYGVTVREALDAILHANGYAYREKGNFVYVYTAREIAELDKANRVANTEVFHLYYTPASNAQNMIKPVLSPEAIVALTTPSLSGIETGAKDVGGNNHATDDMLVITDYPENLEKVHKILKEIDKRPQQILIEATILRAALTEDNALGVDFTVLGGVDFAGLTGAGSNTGEALSGNIVNNAGASKVVDKGFGGGQTGFTGGVPQGGMRVGLVTNNIAVFLQALEQVTDTVVLANPKVLALNKQKGEVIVGRKDGYLTTTQTETSTVQTVDFLDTGTRLVFRPYIGDDGFIRMEIHPEDSSGGLTGANLPFKITTEVTSNIMVKDGHTIVIGGLFRESSDSARSQVPFLGNIPIAGNLFRNQRDRTTREEVIILLTPHIVKDEMAYANASEDMLKEMDKLRVGVRRGMMCFGRERLAESEYESAVKEMNKPNPNRQSALWHLNCATNLNPKFLEALKMKEQLTGVEVTTSDNSTIRGFVRRQILADPARPSTMPVVAEPTTKPSVAKAPETAPGKSIWARLMEALWAPMRNEFPAGDSNTADLAFASTATTQPSETETASTATTQPSGAETAEVGEENAVNTVVTELPADDAVPQSDESEK
jgi:type IV pilus assembly protein PilQ